ncbi:MarC family protein [Dyella sp. C9]|uniref:MarC family protein n=1 Tax=Dyella sp. C9 TaxID=2202154 RepID=UPI000DEF31AC|nr:MarC family protein [Dyella sp. C9]
MLTTTIEALLLVFAALFPVINPFGAALITQGMTSQLDDAGRARLAGVVALNCLALMVGAVLAGTYVLAFFGISVAVLRIAGGTVIAITAYHLLTAPTTSACASISCGEALSKAFYPITLPITVGPGTIAVAVALGTEAIDTRSPPHIVGAGIGIIALTLCIYVCMRYVNRLCRIFGATGSRVIDRLFAFILLCIGMQLGWHGIAELLGAIQGSPHIAAAPH